MTNQLKRKAVLKKVKVVLRLWPSSSHLCQKPNLDLTLKGKNWLLGSWVGVNYSITQTRSIQTWSCATTLTEAYSTPTGKTNKEVSTWMRQLNLDLSQVRTTIWSKMAFSYRLERRLMSRRHKGIKGQLLCSLSNTRAHWKEDRLQLKTMRSKERPRNR